MEEEKGLVASLFHATLIFYHGDLRPAFPWHFPWLEKTVSDYYFVNTQNAHLLVYSS